MEVTDIYYLFRFCISWWWRLKPGMDSCLAASPFLQHALASPLTTIILNSQLALKQFPKTDPQTKYYLENVINQAKYIGQLLHPYQNIGIFSFNRAFTEVITRLHQPNCNRFVSVTNTVTSDQLSGNQLYFQETLCCLIQNAFDSYGHTSTPRLVLVEARNTGNTIHLSITDRGQGMTWLTKKCIFLQGFSRKKIPSGIGMPFARQIICQHLQGNISIKSCRKEGTSIIIQLPLAID